MQEYLRPAGAHDHQIGLQCQYGLQMTFINIFSASHCPAGLEDISPYNYAAGIKFVIDPKSFS